MLLRRGYAMLRQDQRVDGIQTVSFVFLGLDRKLLTSVRALIAQFKIPMRKSYFSLLRFDLQLSNVPFPAP